MFGSKLPLGGWVLFALLLLPSLALSFQAEVIAVSDGDTIRVITEDNQQLRIRLAEIDAPEKKQAFGQKAKQALSDRVFRKMVEVNEIDQDRYGRIVANIYMADDWINAEMVETGLAWVYRAYARSPKRFELEKEAREAKRGLWGDLAPIPPWEWRKKQ